MRMQFDPTVSQALVGPFSVLGLGPFPLYERLGDLVHQLKEIGPGRYLVENTVKERFCIVLYEDHSWRISTTQLDIFSPPIVTREHLATKSPHTPT